MDKPDDLEILDLSEDEIDAADDALLTPEPGDDEDAVYMTRAKHERRREKPARSRARKEAEVTGSVTTETGEQLPIINGVPTERRKKPRTKPDPEYDLRYPDYTLTLTKGLTNRVVKRYYLAHKKGQRLLLAGFAAGVLVLCFIIFSVMFFIFNARTRGAQQAQIRALSAENAELTSEITELKSRVTRLSASVNRSLEDQRALEEAYEQSLLPNGFPISESFAYTIVWEEDAGTDDVPGEETTDTADTGDTVPEERTGTDDEGAADPAAGATDDTEPETDTETEEHRGVPVALFEVREHVLIVASGGGVVTRITDDPAYGCILTIDHRNGFTSMYRNGSETSVSVGDHVERGDTLFTVTAGNTDFAYQIRFNDTDIDPSEMMQLLSD